MIADEGIGINAGERAEREDQQEEADDETGAVFIQECSDEPLGDDINNKDNRDDKAELIRAKRELILPDRGDHGPCGTVKLPHAKQKDTCGENDQRLQAKCEAI